MHCCCGIATLSAAGLLDGSQGCAGSQELRWEQEEKKEPAKKETKAKVLPVLQHLALCLHRASLLTALYSTPDCMLLAVISRLRHGSASQAAPKGKKAAEEKADGDKAEAKPKVQMAVDVHYLQHA